MNREEIEKIVIDAVADELGVNADELSADTNLENDMGADSLDAVEIIITLEREFGVKFPVFVGACLRVRPNPSSVHNSLQNLFSTCEYRTHQSKKQSIVSFIKSTKIFFYCKYIHKIISC